VNVFLSVGEGVVAELRFGVCDESSACEDGIWMRVGEDQAARGIGRDGTEP